MFLVFLVGDTAGIAYFAYKLYMIYQNRSTDYLLVYKSLTVFGALPVSSARWPYADGLPD